MLKYIELFPRTSNFNIPVAFRLPRFVDLQCLERAIVQCFEETDLLSVRMRRQASDTVQEVKRTFPKIDRIRLDQSIEAQKIDQILVKLSGIPFDCFNEALYRIHWVEMEGASPIVLFVFNHLIIDGVSIDILLASIEKRYLNLLHGKEDRLESPYTTSNYPEYIKTQQSYLLSSDYQEDRSFWKETLSSFNESVSFQANALPKCDTDNRWSITHLEIEPGQYKTLQAMTKITGASEYQFFLALVAVALSSKINERRFLLYTPYSNRDQVAFEHSIGLFMNTIPIPVEIDAEESFRSLLTKQSAKFIDLVDHLRYPVEDLLKNSLSEKGMCKVGVFYQSWRRQAKHYEPFSPWNVPFKNIRQRGEFDLVIEIIPSEQRYDLAVKFNSSSVSEEVVRNLKFVIESAFIKFAANEDITVAGLVADEYTNSVLEGLVPHRCELEDISNLARLIDNCLVKYGANKALVYQDRQYSYSELRRMSICVARQLADVCEVQSQDKVAVYLDRSELILPALLGAIYADSVYVPIDTCLPLDRIDYMIHNSGARVCVTNRRYVGKVCSKFEKILIIEDTVNAIDSEPDWQFPQQAGCDYIRYILYTSGSTGRPKGVMVRDSSTVNFLRSFSESPGLKTGDKLLAVTTISFDIAFLELFLPLVTGATVFLCEKDLLDSPAGIRKYIVENGISVLQATPAFFEMILRNGQETFLSTRAFCGGDVLPERLKNIMIRSFAEVWNFYGPTETTIWSTISQQTADERVNVGKPIRNTLIAVLGTDGKECPQGIPGEVYIAGAGLAAGYHNNPEETKKRFVELTISGRAACMFYRTGDLGVINKNGVLELHGRNDFQVKVQGHRIELEEIEVLLLRQPGVEAAVVVPKVTAAGTILLAFVVAPSLSVCAVQELLVPLVGSLPSYMLPSVITNLKQLPYTFNKKVDRAALSQYSVQQVELERECNTTDQNTPHSVSNGQVNKDDPGIACELDRMLSAQLNTKITAITEKRTFGALGFDSSGLVRFSESLTEALGIDVKPQVFFEYNTPARLLSFLQHQKPQSEIIKWQMAPGLIEEHGKTKEIAVIGLALNFPGSESKDAFWDNLVNMRDCVHATAVKQGEGVSTDAGYITDKWYFDHRFFNISYREAMYMDPQQKLILQAVWQLFEDAGYAISNLPSRDVAVFLGTSGLDFVENLISSGQSIDPYSLTGVARSIIANRVSYLFDFSGPSEIVDTACSSSLVAVHRAVSSLRNGECTMAVAGGINLMLDTSATTASAQMGMLSKTLTCKAFDASADGYVRSEGWGLVLLKPLVDAVRDKDFVYGIIKETGVNHGGKANSLTAPNIQAQSSLISSVLRKARVEPGQISFIETHGTGTQLGDPIEIESLKRAFTRAGLNPVPSKSIALGAVKCNIGHAEAAAGIAGLIKLLLSFCKRQIPGMLHFKRLNPNISLSDSAFFIPEQSIAWTTDSKLTSRSSRVATVSSFGFGGANAFLVANESPSKAIGQITSSQPAIIALSARTPAALGRQVSNLLQALLTLSDGFAAGSSLYDISKSLLVGRDQFEHRVAFVANSIPEAIALLQKIEAGYSDARVFQSILQEEVDVEQIDSLQRSLFEQYLTDPSGLQHALERLLRYWTAGLQELDWSEITRKLLPETFAASRCPLPTYSFEKTNVVIKKDDSSRPIIEDFQAPQQAETQDAEMHSCVSVAGKDSEFFAAHQMHNSLLVPAAYYVALINERFARKQDYKISSLTVNTAHFIIKETFDIQTVCKPLPDGGALIELYTLDGEEQESVLLCTAQLVKREPQKPSDLHFEQLESIAGRLSGTDCYDMFQRFGFDYGTSFQLIESICFSKQLCEVALKTDQILRNQKAFNATEQNCIVIDACLQAAVLWANLTGILTSRAFPYQFEGVSVFTDLASVKSVKLTLLDISDHSRIDFSIQCLDDQGNPVLNIARYSLKRAGTATRQVLQSSDGLLSPQQEGSLFIYTSDWVNSMFQQAAALSLRPVFFLSDFESSVIHGQLSSDVSYIALERSLPGEFDDGVTEGKALFRQLASVYVKNGRFIVDMDAIFNRLPVEMKAWRVLFDLFKEIVLQPWPGKGQLVLLYKTVERGKRASAVDLMMRSAIAFLRSLEAELPKVQLFIIGYEDTINLDLLSSEFFDSNECWPIVKHYRYTRTHELEQRILKHVSSPLADSSDGTGIRKDGRYIVVGAGGLGNLLVQYLEKHYNATVFAVRSTSSHQQESFSMQARGKISYLSAEIRQPHDVDRVFQVASMGGKIDGVFNLVGSSEDGLFRTKGLDSFERVFTIKQEGTTNILFQCKKHHIPFCLHFSSIAADLGSLGQSDYAWANAFVEEASNDFNSTWHQQGLKSFAIKWGPWSAGRMRSKEPFRRRLYTEFGIDQIEPDEGIAAVRDFLVGHLDSVGIVKGNQQILRNTFHTNHNTENQMQAKNTYTLGSEHMKTTGNTNAGRLDVVIDYLKKLIASVTYQQSDTIAVNDSFEKLGIDSVMILMLNSKLETKFPGIPKTLFFTCSSVSELAEYLMANFANEFAEKSAAEPTRLTPIANSKEVISELANTIASEDESLFFADKGLISDDDIAIIGIDGKFSGSENLDEFWNNLARGVDSISEVPSDRWNTDHMNAILGKERSLIKVNLGGFLQDIDKFDPFFFNISPLEATSIDPQERLFLETAWHAMEDAGLTRASIASKRVGMYVGAMWGHYQLNTGLSADEQLYVAPTSSYASIANRASYVLGLRGPSIALDTMCSSSLTAIHLACQSIKSAETDMAVAGGVNLTLHPNKYVFLSQTKFIASDGRCRSFGDGGDGYIPGEGVGAVVLKGLRQAVSDGDRIYAVIKGTAINHGGRSNGYTVPGVKAQADVITRTLEAAGIAPETINYVEAHGTGTQLGDPIEIAALDMALGKFMPGPGSCAVGSVKSNVGHCESAAGMAAIAKVVLQMKHRKLVPSLHSANLNSEINFGNSAFRVQQSLEDWMPVSSRTATNTVPLRAGISSFGAGGSNAHVILEQYVHVIAQQCTSSNSHPFLIPISARSERMLDRYILDVIQSLRKFKSDHTIPDDAEKHAAAVASLLESTERDFLERFSYTMQTGREPMEHRVAFVGTTILEFIDKMEAFSKNHQTTDTVFFAKSGQVNWRVTMQLFTNEDGQNYVNRLLEKKVLHSLAALWVTGMDLEWNKMYGNRPLLIEAPVYPFERIACRLPELKGDLTGRNTGNSKGSADLKEDALADMQRSTSNQYLEHTNTDYTAVSMQNSAMDTEGMLYVPLWSASSMALSPSSQVVVSQDVGGQVLLCRATGSVLAAAVNQQMARLEKPVVRQIEMDTLTYDGSFNQKHSAAFKTLDHLVLIIDKPKESMFGLDAKTNFFSPGNPLIWAFSIVKELIRAGVGKRKLRISVLCENAFSIGDRSPVANPYAAAVISYIKCVCKEYLSWKPAFIDISDSFTPAELDMVTRLIANPQQDGPIEIAVRRDGVFVRSLVPLTGIKNSTVPIKQYGCYIVVGGAGNIGYRMSKYLANDFAAHIFILGRRKPDNEIVNKLQVLRESGGTAEYISVDMDDPNSVNAVIGRLKASKKIDGTFYSAMDLHHELTKDMTVDSFIAGLGAKTFGCINFARQWQDYPLDFSLYFSSAESFVGNAGNASYAASCSFMDTAMNFFAERSKFPIKVINWGFWTGNKGNYETVLAKKGIVPLSDHDGIAAMKAILSSNLRQVIALKVSTDVITRMGADLSKIASLVNGRLSVGPNVQEKMFETIKDKQTETTIDISAMALTVQNRPSQVLAGEEEMSLDLFTNRLIKSVFSEILLVDIDRIEDDVDFTSYGADSMIITDIHKKLEEALGKLPVTVLLENTNVSLLTDYFIANYNDRLEALKTQSAAGDVHLLYQRQAMAAETGNSGGTEIQDLRHLHHGDVELKEVLKEVLASVLQIEKDKIDEGVEFAAYGADYSAILKLHNELIRRMGVVPLEFISVTTTISSLFNQLTMSHPRFAADELQTLTANRTDAMVTGNTSLAAITHNDYKLTAAEDSAILQIGSYPLNEAKEFLLSYGDIYRSGELKSLASNTKPATTEFLRNAGPQLLQHLFVQDASNGQLEVFVIGSGDPVLFIPAIGLTAVTWSKQVFEFAKENKVIIIHNPGYGLSEGVKSINVEAVAERYMLVLNKLNVSEPVHIVASCFGGVLGQYLALAYSTRVKSLSLVGSFFENFGLPEVDISKLSIEQLNGAVQSIGASIEQDFNEVLRRGLDSGLPVNEAMHSKDRLLVTQAQCANPFVVMRYATQIMTLRASSWLKEITAPVLCIAGTFDSIVAPETSAIIANTVAAGELVNIEGAGHYPYVTHSQIFNTELKRFHDKVNFSTVNSNFKNNKAENMQTPNFKKFMQGQSPSFQPAIKLLNSYSAPEISKAFSGYRQAFKDRTLQKLANGVGNTITAAELSKNPNCLKHLLVTTEGNQQFEVFMIGQGRPLLMISATGLAASSWKVQFETLKKNRQLIVIHNPGYGLSSVSQQINIEYVGDKFVEVLQTLGVSKAVDIVASCYGGVVGQYMSVQYKSLVNSLTLVGSFYKNFGMGHTDIDSIGIDHMKEGAKQMADAFDKDFDAIKRNRTNGDPTDAALDEARQVLLDAQCVNPLVVMRYTAQIHALSVESWLPAIEVPVLCITGSCDTIVDPAVSSFISSSVQWGRHEQIDGAAHYPYISHSIAFNELLEQFLDEMNAEVNAEASASNALV